LTPHKQKYIYQIFDVTYQVLKYHISPLISLIDRVAADSMTERSTRSLPAGNNATEFFSHVTDNLREKCIVCVYLFFPLKNICEMKSTVPSLLVQPIDDVKVQ